MSYKVDFHTHSIASPDGSLGVEDYKRVLEQGRLDCVAVTDHNTTDMALRLQQELGNLDRRIIVGEEITTQDGEIIGLFLTGTIPAGLNALDAARMIHQQGGLVYVPHPFETVRKGISAATLQRITQYVDIIEVHNGRAVFQNFSGQALRWARQHAVPGAAGSDAHGPSGWGRTYTILEDLPTRDNVTSLLADATYIRAFPGIRALLYPKLNRRIKRRRNA